MPKSKPTAQPEHLTRKQVAEVLNVTERTVDRLTKQGRLTPIKSAIGHGRGGTRIFFDRREVEALKAGVITLTPLDKGLDAGLTHRPAKREK